MIYLDSSVALAHLFEEDRRPPCNFWTQVIRSSRLLEYEVWTRLHVTERADAARASAELLLDAVGLVEMSPGVLARALQPFPLPVRTLDGLHLATMDFLRARGSSVALASYDSRMVAAASAMGFAVAAI